MKHPIVMVTWHDAHAISESWITLPMAEEPCVVSSVGWLIESGKPDHVLLAQSFNDDDAYDHLLAIPVAMIKETKLLSNP